MSLGKLGNTLFKEFKRSPQKTIVLALMVPVAIYFWLPLVTKGWKKKPSVASPVAAAVTTPAATSAGIDEASAAAANASATAAEAPSWESVVQWMAADLLAKPAAVVNATRNPFEKLEPKKEIADEAPEVAAPPAFDPSKLPLHIDGIMVGRVRTATINGRTFREGDRLTLTGSPVKRQETVDPATTLAVVAIRSKQVVFAFGEQSFELELAPLSGSEN